MKTFKKSAIGKTYAVNGEEREFLEQYIDTEFDYGSIKVLDEKSFELSNENTDLKFIDSLGFSEKALYLAWLEYDESKSKSLDKLIDQKGDCWKIKCKNCVFNWLGEDPDFSCILAIRTGDQQSNQKKDYKVAKRLKELLKKVMNKNNI